jgi:hypothetical protein
MEGRKLKGSKEKGRRDGRKMRKGRMGISRRGIYISDERMTVFWDITPCSLFDIERCFGAAYCLHHQERLSFIVVSLRS